MKQQINNNLLGNIGLKRITKSGSITIPKIIRVTANIQQDDKFLIEMQDNGDILLKRITATSILSGDMENVLSYKGVPVSLNDMREIANALPQIEEYFSNQQKTPSTGNSELEEGQLKFDLGTEDEPKPSKKKAKSKTKTKSKATDTSIDDDDIDEDEDDDGSDDTKDLMNRKTGKRLTLADIRQAFEEDREDVMKRTGNKDIVWSKDTQVKPPTKTKSKTKTKAK